MGRNLSIDILKIILAFFVVFLHMHFLKNSYPSISHILVNGIFRTAVPIFLIITGYYFYHIDTLQKLKKWLFRTFLLYFIWSIIYIPLWNNNQIFLNIFFGYHHLWYLLGAILSGILLFILRNLSTKILSVLVIALFFVGYSLQTLGNLHYFEGEIDVNLNLLHSYRNFLFVCFPFLTIGYLINKLKLKIKQIKYPSLLLAISLCLVIAEAYFTFKFVSKEDCDLLISLLICSPVLFLYCQNIEVRSNSKILATWSTAIYLVHPWLMKSFFNVHLESFRTVTFIGVLTVVSLTLVFLNKKLKYLL